MDIFERLKVMRVLRGYSQEELAQRLGISATAYAKIERGDTDVNYSRIKQLADLLKVELADLFGFNEKNVFYIVGNTGDQPTNNRQINYNCGNPQKMERGEQHELELLRKDLAFKTHEIANLNTQITQLNEIIRLMQAKQG